MWCLSLFLSDLSSHVWRNVFPHVSTILGNSHWVVGAGNISLSMANWGAGAFSVQNVDLNTPFREVIQSADFSTLVLPSLSTRKVLGGLYYGTSGFLLRWVDSLLLEIPQECSSYG